MVKRNSWTTIYDFVNKANNLMLGSCMFEATLGRSKTYHTEEEKKYRLFAFRVQVF